MYRRFCRSAACLSLAMVFSHQSMAAGEEELEVQSLSVAAKAETTPEADTRKAEISTFSDSERAEILDAIQHAPKAEDRKTGLSRIRKIRFSPLPRTLSEQLFRSAIFDQDEAVRKEAALAIKDLDDSVAKHFVFNGALNPGVKSNVRENARKALRQLDDPQIVEALVSIVTEEIRAGVASELTAPQTIYITNGLNVNAPLGNINLPIELPNIELKSITGMIAVHALRALRTISARDFGNDPQAWRKWSQDWNHLRTIRMAKDR